MAEPAPVVVASTDLFDRPALLGLWNGFTFDVAEACWCVAVCALQVTEDDPVTPEDAEFRDVLNRRGEGPRTTAGGRGHDLQLGLGQFPHLLCAAVGMYRDDYARFRNLFIRPLD